MSIEMQQTQSSRDTRSTNGRLRRLGRLGRRLSVGLVGASVAVTALGACTAQSALLGHHAPVHTAPSKAIPDQMYTAPTANLTKLANALQFKQKSVTTQVSAPAGLGLTKKVSIQVTNNYNYTTAAYYSNSAGYGEIYNFAPNQALYDGSVHVLLTEQVSATSTKHFTVDYTPLIVALYNVQISNLTFTLRSSCDTDGISETYLQWRDPRQGTYHVAYAQTAGQTVWTSLFSRSYYAIPQNTTLHFPTVQWWESDGQDAPIAPFSPANLVSVGSHVNWDSIDYEATGQQCQAETTFSVNHQLLTYTAL